MKVKVIEKKKEKMILHISGTEHAYMNTLRRYLMNEVPVMSIEDVDFRKNSSILYDEMIAHRLGLVPLTTDLKSYNLQEKCKCKGAGCAQCQLKLTLKGSAEKEPKMICSKDIKSKDAKVKPVSPDIPIVKLLPGQEVQCEMIAVLGKGKEHMKFSGCLAWYKHYPHIKIVKQPANAKELAEKYPFVLEMKQAKLAVNEKALIQRDLIDSDIQEASGGAITYEEKDDFIFYIESWGHLDAKELLEKAVTIHNDDLKEFKKLLKA
ncbi:DNA-directed RNA polymerase subunit D [Nanoarchaeota archaeon]